MCFTGTRSRGVETPGVNLPNQTGPDLTRYQMALNALPACKQFATYVAVGGIGTAFHYAILLTLVRGFAVSAVVASAVGFTGGAVVNYFLNYFWTFKSSKNIGRTFSKFFVIALAGLLINTSLMSVLTARIAIHYFVAQIIATGCVTGITFFGNRHWTFLEVTHD